MERTARRAILAAIFLGAILFAYNYGHLRGEGAILNEILEAQEH